MVGTDAQGAGGRVREKDPKKKKKNKMCKILSLLHEELGHSRRKNRDSLAVCQCPISQASPQVSTAWQEPFGRYVVKW